MREMTILATFLLVSVPICIGDLRSMRIPNRLITIAAGLVWPVAIAARGPIAVSAGAAYVAATLWLSRTATRGALGGGDVKYGLVIGAAVGPAAAPGVLLAAALLGGLGVVVRGGRTPFAPALACSTVGALLAEVLGGRA